MTAAEFESGYHGEVFASLPPTLQGRPIGELGELLCARLIPVAIVEDPAPVSSNSRVIEIAESGEGILDKDEGVTLDPGATRLLNLLRLASAAGVIIPTPSLRDFCSSEETLPERKRDFREAIEALRARALVESLVVEKLGYVYKKPDNVTFRDQAMGRELEDTGSPDGVSDEKDGSDGEMHQSEADTAASGDFVWDEEESDALRRARLEAKLTQSADAVGTYLKQIGKVPLLSAEEEVALAKSIEAGVFAHECIDAGMYDGKDIAGNVQLRRDLRRIVRDGARDKNHLLEANLRLVVSLAKRYTGRGMAFLDLIQEGNLGLIRAVEKFDYTKGNKFSTYATWWIRQSITRSMADQARTIRIPVHMVEVINKLGRIERELRQDFGRPPTPEELAKEMDMTVERVLEIRQNSREPISLDQTVGDSDESSVLGDFIMDKNAAIAHDVVAFGALQDQLQSVLATLSEREAGVIRLRFGLTGGTPRTLDEIGRAYGLTRERIRQIESRTMSKLRHPSRSEVLVDYYE